MARIFRPRVPSHLIAFLIFHVALSGAACQSDSDERAVAPPPKPAASLVPTPAKSRAELDAELFSLVSGVVATDEGAVESPANVAAAERLLAQGADVNAVKNGEPLLIMAARNGHIQVMKLLLNRGADVNARDDRGRTALMVAAGLSDPGMVRLLLSKGADVSARGNDGYTAWTASEMVGGGRGSANYREMRRLLKDAGAK